AGAPLLAPSPGAEPDARGCSARALTTPSVGPPASVWRQSAPRRSAAPPAAGPGRGRRGRRAPAPGQENRFCLWTAELARVRLFSSFSHNCPAQLRSRWARDTSPHSSPHWRLHAAGREGLNLIRPCVAGRCPMTLPVPPRARQGFTLIELLVVIAIIAILI